MNAGFLIFTVLIACGAYWIGLVNGREEERTSRYRAESRERHPSSRGRRPLSPAERGLDSQLEDIPVDDIARAYRKEN